MKRTTMLGLCVGMVLAGFSAAWAAGPGDRARVGAAAPATGGKHVDLVICLDTSNSMDGLIASAKQKLWAVVNELATARPRPILRVGLYHYGNNGLDAKTGWVEKLCDLTDNLDGVYSKLFALRTYGGTEYVARVVKAAVDEMPWNTDKGTLRVIFVAGNEPATQDTTLKLQDVCKSAASRGIIINTIYCEYGATGEQGGWQDAARWADGQYAAINADRGTVVVNSPYDKKLADLSVELNGTYVAFGAAGKDGARLQADMETAAGSMSPSAHAERAQAKASGLYVNDAWDLVDAKTGGKVDLAKMDPNALPEKMRKMTPKEREAYVAGKAARRDAIQKEIRDLSAKREAFVKEQVARQGLSEKQAFDAALRSAVRRQAEQKDFRFEK